MSLAAAFVKPATVPAAGLSGGRESDGMNARRYNFSVPAFGELRLEIQPQRVSGLVMSIAAHLALVLVLLCIAGPAQARSPLPQPAITPPPTDWVSTLDRDHPLAGKLWAVERGIFQPLDVLAREIVFEDFVLLGEVHDNADHHRLRAWVIDSARLVWQTPTPPRPAGAVFEHIRADQVDWISERVGGLAYFADATTLMERLDWVNSGWPKAEIFAPLFTAVALARMPTWPGDATRETVRTVAMKGTSTLPAEVRTWLGLDTPLTAPLQDALLTELEASHCGLLPKTAFGNMAEAQRFRDATLADNLLKAAESKGSAILFAGNGHVRSDRAVPAYLRARAPGKKVVSVQFLEVEAGKTDPASYVPRAPDGRPAADYIVFTPATSRPDPCDAMRAMMAGKKKP